VATQAVSGSSVTQGRLWGARARDWAEWQEPVQRPLYQAVLDATGVGSGTALLDVGCGSGLACALAATRGASVSGLDAAAGLVEIARERLPQADLRVGEMETLPFADRAFDVVTGFNSFQYAANPVGALREARRVSRPGAPVVIMTWGRKDDCDAAAYIAALGSVLPPPPPGAPGPFALSDETALKALATEAGLSPHRIADVDCPFTYPDLETALRALLSAGPAVRAIEAAGEERVREVVTQALTPYRTASGGYHLENVFRYLIAHA